jgi:large subunit ribosomal protein L11
MESGVKMSKETIGKIKLTIPAKKATPSPPVGPMLGQHGINIMTFCKEFNSATSKFRDGTFVVTSITLFKDKSYLSIVKGPPIKQIIHEIIKKRTSNPKKLIITLKEIYEISKYRQLHLKFKKDDLKSICFQVLGTLHSMNITVVKK